MKKKIEIYIFFGGKGGGLVWNKININIFLKTIIPFLKEDIYYYITQYRSLQLNPTFVSGYDYGSCCTILSLKDQKP